jgi:hypothetical protein
MHLAKINLKESKFLAKIDVTFVPYISLTDIRPWNKAICRHFTRLSLQMRAVGRRYPGEKVTGGISSTKALWGRNQKVYLKNPITWHSLGDLDITFTPVPSYFWFLSKQS